jgi:alpha,alpha-trehalose phosphorylase
VSNIINKLWGIIEKNFSIESNYINESLFAIGNGYIGMRGNFEEGYSGPKGTGLEGMYINGFYESETIKYGEVAYGYADKGQTMLNVTNSKIIRLYIEGEEFDMLNGELEDYSRSLDFKNGTLRRCVVWKSPNGKRVKLEIERLVSFKRKHVAAISCKVTPLNFSGKLKFVSA